MLLYRKKLLLAILEAFNTPIEKIKFQKYLFLICQLQKRQSYNFLPYTSGCFSFESHHDRRTLINAGYLKECADQWALKNP